MKRIYILLCMFVLLSATVAVLANTPIVSGQVVTDSGVTRYIYTVTNTLDSGNYIFGFYHIIIPNGSILPMSHVEPSGWDYWYETSDFYTEGKYYWTTPELGNDRLAPGQSAVFEVYTSAPVTTKWTSDWIIGVKPDNGRYYGYSADAPLPIPVPVVPEPSSILALFGGLASIGGFALRRRPQC
ncbi:MAG: PEP-CTERM sorting domain-containing protein [Armatimonadota bacterium]